MTAKDKTTAKSKGGRKLTTKREASVRAALSGMMQADSYDSPWALPLESR